MIVTRIEAVTKTKYKVYVDEKFAFALYKGELSRYHLAAGKELESELYIKIRKEIVGKRAKIRAMHLLNNMGRTEMQLRQKLVQDNYTEDIIDEAIDYVKSFGYINDETYTKNFIDNRKNKRSKKEISAQLLQKGISKAVLEKALEECYGSDSAQDAITAILQKKQFDPKTADRKETQKIMGYLVRKGFEYEDIRQVIQVYEWDA